MVSTDWRSASSLVRSSSDGMEGTAADTSRDPMAAAASRDPLTRPQFREKETIKATDNKRRMAATTPRRTRRNKFVFTLTALAASAASSASNTWLKKFLKKTHCGTLRGGEASAADARAP